MNNNFLISNHGSVCFNPGTSVLHRIGAEKKIALLVIFFSVISLGDKLALSITGGLLLSGWFISGARVMEIFRCLKRFSWFLLIVGIFPALFTPGKPVDVLFLPVTWEGVETGVLSMSRLALMFLGSILLMRTTPPKNLRRAANWLGERFYWAGNWTQETLEVGIMAVQMIPRICMEAETWMASREYHNYDSRRMGWIGKTWLVAGQAIGWIVFLFANREKLCSQQTLQEKKFVDNHPGR